MKVAYVAGPYRDTRGHWYVMENIERARDVAVDLWRMGYAALCPHMNTAHFDGAAPDSVWMEGGLEFVRRSDLMVLFGRWRDSEGTIKEVALALQLGLPIYTWPDMKTPIPLTLLHSTKDDVVLRDPA